jgi:hypothetical protein
MAENESHDSPLKTAAITSDGSDQAPTRVEERLTADEERLTRDETRLYAQEQRLADEGRWLHRAWRLELVLGGVLALTIAALVISVVALNRNIDAVANATPKDKSVGTAALKDGAVTSNKLAGGAVVSQKLAKGAVGRSAIAPNAVAGTALAAGAVGTKAIANGAVNGSKVASNGLTGANINESSLGTVPSATQATTAGDAGSLAGVAGSRYLSRATVVQAVTGTSTAAIKGPLTATCPKGARIIAGGASISGVSRDVAITASAPDGEHAWVAQAATVGQPTAPWRLQVTAICAIGG